MSGNNVPLFAKKENRSYELAATVRQGSVEIYGQALEELCRWHRAVIARAQSLEVRAVEQGRLALLLLGQLDRFGPRRGARLNEAVALLTEAAAALEGMENRERTKYSRLIRSYRELLSEITSGKTIPRGCKY